MENAASKLTGREVLKALYQTLGEQAVFDVEFVETIPLGPTGKHQGSISKINIDFQQINNRRTNKIMS